MGAEIGGVLRQGHGGPHVSVELGHQAEGDMVRGDLSKSAEWNLDMLQLGRFVGTLL